MICDIVRRLAYKIWQVFEKEEIPNDAEGNWSVAEDIIRRIIDGRYQLEEFESMLQSEDVEMLRKEVRLRLQDNE